jgi:hypothetical protein
MSLGTLAFQAKSLRSFEEAEPRAHSMRSTSALRRAAQARSPTRARCPSSVRDRTVAASRAAKRGAERAREGRRSRRTEARAEARSEAELGVEADLELVRALPVSRARARGRRHAARVQFRGGGERSAPRLPPEIRALRRGSRDVPPWAHSGCELSSGFGIRAGYERTFGVTSALAERELETTAFAYEAQLEFEFPLALFSVTPRAASCIDISN